MKKIKLASLLVLFITAFTFTSCDNEPIDSAIDLGDFDNGGGGTATGAFTAKIGTDNFNANQAIEADYTSTALGTQLSIIGVASNGKTMAIQILNPIIGTRTASSDINNLLLFQYFASVNDQYSSLNVTTTQYNGTINITEFNTTTNKISGTFSFTGYGALSSTAQVEVTQGVFTNISFDNSVTTPPTPTPGIAGTYLLTNFNTSVPTDLNGDGTASTNQINETSCLANSILTLNANNTFSSDSKGIDIGLDLNTGVSTIECYDDPPITGTWSLSGNQLTFTYIDEGVPTSDVFTVSGNTLSYTVQSGQVVGTASGGEPVYLTSDITLIYTKQ